MDNIKVINADILDNHEKDIMNHVLDKHYKKISRLMDNFDSIILHVKENNLSKNQKKSDRPKKKNYIFKLRVVFGKDVFESSNDSWDLGKALNEVFQKVEREIEHKFRESFS